MQSPRGLAQDLAYLQSLLARNCMAQLRGTAPLGVDPFGERTQWNPDRIFALMWDRFLCQKNAMNLFFHQLIVSAVLCWFAAISKHVKQLCLVFKSSECRWVWNKDGFSAELQQTSWRKSKTLAPARGTARRSCPLCRAAYYLAKGLYKIQ